MQTNIKEKCGVLWKELSRPSKEILKTVQKIVSLVPTEYSEKTIEYTEELITTLVAKDKALNKPIAQNKIDNIQPWAFTQDTLVGNKGRRKTTGLHVAASRGSIACLPKEFITEENFDIKDASDQTPLHLAALNGLLHLVPQELLTQKLLLTRGSRCKTVLHYIRTKKDMQVIPIEILTVENLQMTAMNFDTVFQTLTRANLLSLVPEAAIIQGLKLVAKDGGNLATYAAQFQQIEAIPTKYLTEEMLLQKNMDGDTALNLLIATKKLDLLLGFKFSEACKEIVGSEWYEKNQSLISAKANAEKTSKDEEIQLF